ncbi:hypothetical protein Zmor_007652 [Zophobas morio]|uniref:7tm 6 domain containing protein n=1 Tax=Zophobas morio TaxID=2755281 RepID=A0AA38IU02_9CUCU|nr:hypothetical protein Zmor_007652 [Zophobas morio]
MDKFNWKFTIRFNMLILKIAGLWPKGNEVYKFNRYTIYSIFALNLFINGHNFFQAANILFVYTDLTALTAIIFVTVTDLLASVKVYYFVSNIGILKKLMVTLDGQLFQPRTLEQRSLVQPGLDSWKFTYVAFCVPVITTLILWAVFPIMDGSFREYRLPFSAWYPYNTKVSPLYELTYVYQIVSIWFLALTNVNMDTLIAALMMYVGTQCDILSDDVRNLGSRGVMEFNTKLLNCIDHHRNILSFAGNCNKFFDKIALGQFFTSSLSLALAMFQLTVVEPLSSEFYSLLFYVFSMTVQISLYCWFGNEVEIKVRNSG